MVVHHGIFPAPWDDFIVEGFPVVTLHTISSLDPTDEWGVSLLRDRIQIDDSGIDVVVDDLAITMDVAKSWLALAHNVSADDITFVERNIFPA